MYDCNLGNNLVFLPRTSRTTKNRQRKESIQKSALELLGVLLLMKERKVIGKSKRRV